MTSTKDILAASGGQQQDGIKISELVGQTISITDFTTTVSKKYPGRVFANFGYIDQSGDEGRAYTGAVAVVSKLEALREAIAEPGGVEVKVTSYGTDKGDGYDITNPD